MKREFHGWRKDNTKRMVLDIGGPRIVWKPIYGDRANAPAVSRI